MMEFYIGGFAQGKLEYVLQAHQGEELEVWDGACTGLSGDVAGSRRIVFNHFHLWVRRLLGEGEDPERLVREFLEKHGDCIIISDEVGSGIVPVGQEERAYRECLGRIQVQLAAGAGRVERVICGIGQRLK